MANTKIFMAEMPVELHAKMKMAAAYNGDSMKQFVNDAIEKAVMENQHEKVNMDELTAVLRWAYRFLKDGPLPELTERIKAILEAIERYG